MGDKLAVILPSRGLMFSKTFDRLLDELKDFNYEIYFSHGNPIPDCFNEPTERALKDQSVFALLFVEDDMIIPKGILQKMFNQNYPVVALDYPFKNNGDATTLHDPHGNAYWTGTGFLLVARGVLDQMEKPIWRTDTAWDTMVKGDKLVFWPRKLKKVAYGLHDVNFGMTLYSQGLPIKTIEETAGQYKLRKLGTAHSNKGQHGIKELKIVGRDMVIKTLSPEKIDTFRRAMNRVRQVEIMDHIPEFIEYIDGQAHVKGEKYELV